MKNTFFNQLSQFFTPTDLSTVQPNTPVIRVKVDDQGIKMILDEAEKKRLELLLQAKDESKVFLEQIQTELEEVKQEYEQIEKELDKKNKTFATQETLFSKKQKSVEHLSQEIHALIDTIQKKEEVLLTELEEQSNSDREALTQYILEESEQTIEQDTQKDLQLQIDDLIEHLDRRTQEILVQVMPQGAHNYTSEYTPPIISFTNEAQLRKVCGQDNEHLKFIEELTGVEITYDPDRHQLKLYAYNTVQREVVRVLFERLLKAGSVFPNKITQLYQMTKADLDREMFQEGKYLCNQLRIFDLPREIVQRLGMFKFRYSYGQNMIVHTLEEAKIGIALAEELGADTQVVRLGCLFHDIGKVIYEIEGNHVETGVEFLKKFNMPAEVVNCVAESHEDIPFSSIESMIVHVADSISGARPGARFDDYEGFLKHQQGLIDITMAHKGVMDAYVINGGREIRVTVNPSEVNDEAMDTIATEIRDQVQEFSTYPGSIVVNLMKEVQHSELIA